ncbi:ATP-binding cassette domain-containing protein [Pseudoalteromonas sp. MMG006]|uniref:ABC transporter transmembrane domain-containing protein n=1 Tax=Pseudoalteromonas sp. MMG006 TaxID=2822683 RepID=UPI001B35E6CB|nr:ABC transporter transmembrane domain-containing protein [Pseudoalteromonas sp. MMG006]MBQ4800733.1 ATP-binding cassette domain-containing protein [Pseudoalteromonas sp. MMG006]
MRSTVIKKILINNPKAKPLIYNLLLVSVSAIVLTSFAVLFVQYLIDSVIPNGELKALYIFILFFVIYDSLRVGLTYFSGVINGILFKYLNVKLLLEMLNKLIYSSVDSIHSYKKGELIQRMYETQSVKNYLVTFFVQFWSNLLAMLCCSLVILIISWQAFLVVMVSSVILFLTYRVTSNFVKVTEEERFNKRSNFLTNASFIIENIQSIKTSGLTEHYYQTSAKNLIQYLNLENKLHFFRIKLQAFVATIQFIALNTVRCLLVYLMFTGLNTTIGKIVTVLALSDRIFKFISQIFTSLVELQRQGVQVRRIYDFLKDSKDFEYTAGKNKLSEQKLNSIGVSSVKIKVSSNKELSFPSATFYRQDIVHVKGAVGAGKTTFCLYLSGMTKSSSGTLYVNNRAVSNTNEMSELTSYTGPGDVIFEGSVLFNIFLGRPEKIDALTTALELLESKGFIESLPKGWNTKLGGTSGIQLSEGQKQTIFFLRVYFSEKQILIFDEIFRGMDINRRVAAEQMIADIKDKIVLFTTHQKPRVLFPTAVFDVRSNDFERVQPMKTESE